jgi:L-lactate dehydrogenase (cytochrome)
MRRSFDALEPLYPTTADLHRGALRHLPRFVADYIDGGSGANAASIRNQRAFESMTLTPRHGRGVIAPELAVPLFGQAYAAPFGVAPMGLGALVRPRLEARLARAAQAARIPYVLSTAASAGIETIAHLAPDVFWFQLFGLPRDDHRVTLDLVRRAERAGAKALVLTIDTPVQARRPTDLRNRLGTAGFERRPRILLDILRRPGWASEMLLHGRPGCEVLRPYLPSGATAAELTTFARSEIQGGFSWDLVRRIRDLWPRALVVKGLLDRRDAAQAIAAGADGIIVSNHGGRTFDAAPASLDRLPEIAASCAGKAAVMLDGGLRSGLDIARAVASGATAAFLGRPFLHAVAAVGDEGGDYLIALLEAELRHSMIQLGTHDSRELATVAPGRAYQA